MLSGEGNAEKLAKKGNFARAAHLFCRFLCRFFTRDNVKLPETSLIVARFMEEMSYIFSFTFFNLLPLIFILHWWPLAFLILSPPLQNFDVVLPTKKHVSFVFSLSL